MSRRFLQGASGWAPTWQTSDSGRRFARNKENTGTIMEWNDAGTVRNTVVFDAVYRDYRKLYSSTIDLELTTFTKTGSTVPSEPSSGTDTILNNDSNFSQDVRGNTAATDEWMNNALISAYTKGAICYVRSLTSLSELGCDLPTINCLSRIYSDRTILDSMDPTASRSSYSLSEWAFSLRFLAWSSSWYGYTGSFCGLGIRSNGQLMAPGQTAEFGIIPVIDI